MNQEVGSVRPGVEALEAAAGALLEEARARGEAVLRDARRQAAEWAAADIPMDEVEAECAALIEAAHAEARRSVERAGQDAMTLKASAATKAEGFVQRIVSLVAGDSS